MSIFSEKLRTCRKERGLTTTAAAAALDVTQPAWNQWELGLREPKLDVLVKIANLLDCSADWLLGLKDNGGVSVKAGNGAAVAIGANARASAHTAETKTACRNCRYKKMFDAYEAAAKKTQA